jgi:O-antigen ligase
VLLAALAFVPCVFTTRLADTFTLPKLVALWGAVVLALGILSIGAAFGGRAVVRFARSRTVDVALVAFLGWNVVAFAFSTDLHQSLFGERFQYQGLLTLLLYAAGFLLARVAFTGERDLSHACAAVACGGAAVAAYAIAQEVGFDPIWHGYLPAGRVFSSIGQSNSLAAFFVFAIPLTASFCWRASLRVRLVAVGVTIAMTAGVLFTYSRGGYLAMLVMIPTVLLVGARDIRANSRRLARGGAAVLAVAAVLVLLVAPVRAQAERSWNRLVSSGDVGEASVRTHLDFWNIAVDITRDHPLVGTGQDTYPDIFPRYIHTLPYFRAVALSQYRIESPHNVYFAIAAGAGLPALAAYLALLVAVGAVLVRSARGARRPERRVLFGALVTALVAHLVTDSFMTADLVTTWMFWTLMGAGVAAALRPEPARP